MGEWDGWSGLNLCTLPPGGSGVPWVVKSEMVGGGFAKIRLWFWVQTLQIFFIILYIFFISYLLETLTEIAKCKQASHTQIF